MSSFDDKKGKAPFGVVFDPSTPQSQIPYRYQILKERARLRPCCYWGEPDDPKTAEEKVIEEGVNNNVSAEEPLIYEFTTVTLPIGTLEGPVRTEEEIKEGHRILPAELNRSQPITVMGGWSHETSPSFYIKPVTLETVKLQSESIPSKCMKEGAEPWNQGANGFPPCNGAMTECPFYTGPRFKYTNDEDIFVGEQILAEQIQELRFLSREWSEFYDPRGAWNRVYEEPDIFARAHNPPLDLDPPVATSSTLDGHQQPLSKMTRVHWDHALGDVVRTKEFSTPEGILEESSTGMVSPPGFYTLIKNVGESSGNPIKITFPPNQGKRDSEDTQLKEPLQFAYEHSKAYSDIIYFAGISLPKTSLFIVNTTIHPNFPFEESQLEDDEFVSAQVEELIERYFTEQETRGFRINKTDNTGFWEDYFVHLNPGINRIIVLSSLEGKWSFARAEVAYHLYQMEFIQGGYQAQMVDGQVPFVSYLANSRPATDVVFQGYQLGQVKAEVDSVYHFYVQQRDLFRLCNDEEPDRRTFQYSTEEITEEVKFWKLDRCNTFMCEITETNIPTISPLGLDRSMEIEKVTMYATLDVDSGPGEDEEVEIEMQVSPFRGRNIEGIALPVRFFKIEPLDSQDLRKIDETRTRVEVTYSIFRGESLDQLPDGRQEETANLLSTFKDPQFRVASVGGISIFSLDEDTVPAPGLEHHPRIEGDNVFAGNPSKGDLSYVIQYRSSLTGNLIGRKWVYGVVEISKFWARDIEIRYSWCSEYSTLTALLPAWRKFGLDVDFSDLGNEHAIESGRCRRVGCGDHETSSLGEGGPLFFPYDACGSPMYLNRDVARWLNQPVPEVDPVDEKYRAPDRYEYKTLEHHVFGFLRPDCFMEWSMGTINNVGSSFNGYSRPRGPISPFVRPLLWFKYITKGWRLPPLGNRGREAIRVFKSMHYQQYMQKCNNPLCGFCVRMGWLPALPYAGNSDFMVDSAPRSIFDQTYNENHSFIRRKWNDVFYLRNTFEPVKQGRVSQPVQWPRIGYHPDFRRPDYVWAWEERVQPLERGDNLITGVRIRKPSVVIQGNTFDAVGRDFFFRPVNYHPHEEDNLVMTLVPEVYDSKSGRYVERAHLVLGDNGEKLYFDEVTGEIQENSGAVEIERKQIYAMGSKQELIDNEISPSVNEIYTQRVGMEGANPPESLEQIDEYFLPGNLISNPEEIDVYLVTADIFGEEEGTFEDRYAGFFRSLTVENIAPKFLPREELYLSDKEDLFAQVQISDYPLINPGLGITPAFSNQYIPLSRARILGGIGRMQWNPPLPGEDEGSEQIEGFKITIQFRKGLMLSSLGLTYEVFGGVSQEEIIGQPPPPVAPSIDPSIQIKLFNTATASEKVLYEKPEFTEAPDFIPDGLSPVVRILEFRDEFSSKDYYDRVEISVGPRNAETGFTISLLQMSSLFIKRSTEVINVKESQCIVEVGPHPDALPPPFNFPSEGDYENKREMKMAFGVDTSDIMEINGIAEFWQPSLASTSRDQVVGTLGRLRREWANGWDTADVALHLGEISTISQYDRGVVRGGDVEEDHENRQIDLMKGALEQAASDGVPVEELSIRISDDDRKFFKFITGSEGEPSYGGMKVIFDAGVNRYLDQLENSIKVSRGEKEPGWQAEGFWACLGGRAKTRVLTSPTLGHCKNLGGGIYGTYTPEWNTTHGVCGKNVGDPMNSDYEDYFGGISIGDIGHYMTRRLIMSGGDAGAAMASPPGQLMQNDGHVGSVQDAISQEVREDLIDAESSQGSGVGIPEPPSGPRNSRR